VKSIEGNRVSITAVPPNTIHIGHRQEHAPFVPVGEADRFLDLGGLGGGRGFQSGQNAEPIIKMDNRIAEVQVVA